MTMTRAQAVADGYLIDRGQPPVAYKGGRFNPEKWFYIATEAEERLQAELDELTNSRDVLIRELVRMTDVRDELLEVLKEAELVLAEKLRRLGADPNVSPTTHRIRAAIFDAMKEKP